MFWSLFPSIGDAFRRAWFGLWILLDSVVYWLVSISYQVFILIGKASLFNSENGDISVIVNRVSVILGIGMLFVIAYNIILLIMNPDKFSSGGDKSMQGIFKNAIFAIVMLTAYSTVFTYMSKLQNSIIDSQVIEKIILGSDNSNNTTSSDMGSTVATKIFLAFYYPIDNDGNMVTYDECETSSLDVCKEYRKSVEAAETGSIATFINSSKLFDSLLKDTPHMKYLYFISTVCGVIALLMFVSYVIDIGIRVAKLAFLQIIAPIPIMLYITKPSGGIFSKWLDNLIKTYLSLFMRLITIYFSMLLISVIASNMGNNNGGVFGDTSNVNVIILMFGYLVLILGILLFAKDAPKLLENLLGTTFGEGGGFSPKAIAKKLGGAYDTATKPPILGKLLDKGVSGAAGAAGAGWSAFRNNRKLKKGGKGAEGLTHMDVKKAMQQGRTRGISGGGGVSQFSSQGKNVYESTYGYGKKQGFFGGKSRDTRREEKYGKAYDNNVKEHAKARNDEIRNKAIGHEIPGNVTSACTKATDYIKQNTEFENYSPIYDKVKNDIRAEEIARGFDYTKEERKAKINEKLSQISATTTDANEKRAIDSYLSRDSVISEYNSSVLTGNKEAIAKVETEAKNRTNAIVKAEIESKGGIKAIVSDPTIKTQLESKVTAKINAEVDKSFTAEMEQKIRDSVANISFTNSAEAEKYIQGKITKEKEQMATKIREESGDKYYEAEVQSYANDLETTMFNEKYKDVKDMTMTEAENAAANKIAEGVMKYEEGRIRGDHTNNSDGSFDQVYNAEYATNEKISTGGVKTKSAEDLAWDKIKKAVLDQDKKK